MWKRGALSLRALASQPFFSYPRSQGTYPKVTVFPEYESPVHRRPVHLYDATVRFSQYTGRRQYSTGNEGDDNRHDVSQKRKATGVDDQWDFSAEGDKWDDFDAPVEEPEGLGSKTEDAIDWGSSAIDEGGDWSVQAQADSKDVGEEDWTSRTVDSPWISEDGGSRKPEVQEGDSSVETLRAARMLKLKEEEKHLTSVLEDTNRAFGDLIAQSGITEVQIESLMVMKDLEGIQGLPPLKEIEDARYLKMKKRSVRSELEQKRQEQTAIQRVRKVDQKGRAYGLGKRKCSSARVWIQPGNGQIIVNKRSFDEYFTALYLRTDILKPFIMTKTLGLWDVVTIARGGGLSGQAGAIRLGISRALQNWEPGFRPYLKAAGLMTRDSRVVERKKPGKAKARKSFQWVKR